MRSLEEARRSWQEVRRCTSLPQLKEAIRLDGSSSLATEGGRSACWKAFLLFESLDLSVWQETLSSSRSAYNSLRAHFSRHLDNPDSLEASYDPLAEETDASPWVQLRKDEELRAEILQDVARCMPENLYFRQPDTQQMLVDILFVFCKLNPDIGYRQGMHELLAPILWVVERDAIDLGGSSKAMGEDAVITNVFDADHIEHDTFALFGQIMQSAKNFYEQSTMLGKENPIVVRSRVIFVDLLSKVDERLARHLQSIDIVPQIFMMRWIRLLFGREFAFDDLLTMWDVIFAEDTTLEIVNEICLVLLLRIRWQLLEADYNAALALLLRYPDLAKEPLAQTCVLDALYLRRHMDAHGGSYLVSKYSGRSLHTGRPITPPAFQRNVTTISGLRANKTSRPITANAPSSARDINNVLRSAANDIYARGEKLGIGKAVRNAVEEVHKRAQEIRDAPTPTPPISHRSRGSFGAESALRRVKALEERNRSLAKLLEGATSELWAYQKTAVERADGGSKGTTDDDGVAALCAAIAKVQFVQVYLRDASLQLSDDITQENSAADAPSRTAADPGVQEISSGTKGSSPQPHLVPEQPGTQTDDLTDPSSFEDTTLPPGDDSKHIANNGSDSTSLQPKTAPTGQNESSAKLARPSLEQSPFSWMLEEQKPPQSSSAKGLTFSPGRGKSKGFLFGDETQ